MNTIRTLIAEDEEPARQRLTDLINKVSEASVAGVCEDGRSTVEAIREVRPDLVFLDVEMPELDGLEVVQTVGPDVMPATIFVTAYDEYAIEAFEVAALDYLLKPFDDERFRNALQRARQHIQLRKAGTLEDRLRTLLEAQDQRDDQSREDQDQGAQDPPKEEYLKRIAVETRQRVRIVPVEQIDYVEADGPYLRLQTGEETHLVRERMKTLEKRLDPSQFVRIHRSTIVNLDRLEELIPQSSGTSYEARLEDGTTLKVSRSRREDLLRTLKIGSP